MARAFLLLLFLSAGFLGLTGCAETAESTVDDPSTFQPGPEKPEDGHGWGTSVQSLSR